ncbi:MAG: hypothetical protein MJ075_05260 [Oscillospiraceae bacterium]|nr:hypothetical protein [Oscillospiraceae bacterium]
MTCFVNTAFTGWNRGAGENDVFMAGTIGQVSFRALLAWLLAPSLGLNGVALATGIGWSLLIVFKAILYFVKKKKDPPEGANP